MFWKTIISKEPGKGIKSCQFHLTIGISTTISKSLLCFQKKTHIIKNVLFVGRDQITQKMKNRSHISKETSELIFCLQNAASSRWSLSCLQNFIDPHRLLNPKNDNYFQRLRNWRQNFVISEKLIQLIFKKLWFFTFHSPVSVPFTVMPSKRNKNHQAYI